MLELHGLHALHALHELHELHALHELHGLHELHALHALHELHGLHELHELHGLHGLHELRELHGLHGLHELHELHGLHELRELHGLRELLAVPALRGFRALHELRGLCGFVVNQWIKFGESEMDLKKLLEIEQVYSFVKFRRYYKEKGSVFMVIVEAYGIETDMTHLYNHDLSQKENAIKAVKSLHKETLVEEFIVIHASYDERRNGYHVVFVEEWRVK